MGDMPADVAAAFAGFGDDVQPGILALRRLIFEVAGELGAPIEEALRWGEPAYLAPMGSTIRLGVPKAGGYGLFVICTTRLIEDFRAVVGDRFRFDGTRGVLFTPGEDVDEAALALLIRAALTYKVPG